VCDIGRSFPPLQIILKYLILQIETTNAPQQQAQAATPRAETIERYFSLSFHAFPPIFVILMGIFTHTYAVYEPRKQFLWHNENCY